MLKISKSRKWDSKWKSHCIFKIEIFLKNVRKDCLSIKDRNQSRSGTAHAQIGQPDWTINEQT